MNNNKIIFTLQTLCLTGLVCYLGYFVQRPDFWSFFAAYTVFFLVVSYVLFVSGQWSVVSYASATNHSPFTINKYIVLGIFLRVLLVGSIPNLSDDFYRFLWDGRLLAAGWHPFAHPPVWYVEQGVAVPGLTEYLYNGMNSRLFHTVYPPVCQAVFWLAAILSPGSEAGGVLVLKIFLLACELGTLHLLYRHVSPKAAVFYALNPLILLEIMGNAHFEGAMITFLVAGVVALRQQKTGAAAVWWALAVASKLVPLLLLPVVWRWLGWRRGWGFMVLFGLSCGLLFLPLLDLEVLRHMSTSLRLYFREFEFNASLYYLVKTIANALAEQNVGRFVGMGMSLVTIVGVLYLATRKITKSNTLAMTLTAALTLYLLNSNVVHPWYVTVPFALSLFLYDKKHSTSNTKHQASNIHHSSLNIKHSSFLINHSSLNIKHSSLIWWVWTGSVALSYSHYIGGGLKENFWLIGLEYALVLGVFILARYQYNRPKS
jgi:alpha-1,6-mannosyltransferase